MFNKTAFLAFLLSLNCLAQRDSLASHTNTVSVEKSIFGIQTGLFGIWANNESRLTEQISLRSELGLELAVLVKSRTSENGATYVIAPTISLEPRWYYNLEKRNFKGKNISNNSGNILSLRALYYPDSFLIGNEDRINVVNQIAIVPKWGMRRVYREHFAFETGIGLGPSFLFGKSAEAIADKNIVFLDLTLRIGYNF